MAACFSVPATLDTIVNQRNKASRYDNTEIVSTGAYLCLVKMHLLGDI